MPDFSNLLDQTIDAPNATVIRMPPDSEYRGIIDDIKIATITIGKGERKGQEVPQLHIFWSILDEAVKASLERDKLIARQTLWLDLDTTGQLSTGPDKNVDLGRLREVFDLNHAGFSLGQLKGTPPAAIKTKVRTNEDDPNRKYLEVVNVSKFK